MAKAEMTIHVTDRPAIRAAIAELLAERDALRATVQRVEALAAEWRYKGEFGWGPWQAGEGPDIEGQILDDVACRLRVALNGATRAKGATDTRPAPAGAQAATQGAGDGV